MNDNEINELASTTIFSGVEIKKGLWVLQELCFMDENESATWIKQLVKLATLQGGSLLGTIALAFNIPPSALAHI
jgi:hypothetical protein